jgi:hypothetical protein
VFSESKNLNDLKTDLCRRGRLGPRMLVLTVVHHVFMDRSFRHRHHHYHHVAVKELGHLLTLSGLTHPEVPSVVFFGSFLLSSVVVLSMWVKK